VANQLRNDSESQAWDIYFAAALTEAKPYATGGSTEAFLGKQVKIAADIADRMIEARRQRL
jgi:hypothetical protein